MTGAGGNPSAAQQVEQIIPWRPGRLIRCRITRLTITLAWPAGTFCGPDARAPLLCETLIGAHFCEPRFRPAQDLPGALPSKRNLRNP